MRRDYTHSLGPRQARAQIAQRLGEGIVLDRVHRRTMADEQHWHPVHAGSPENEISAHALLTI
jgi:hypothetical protein